MITPRFSCSQTDASVIIRAYLPTVRASDVELHVDGILVSLHVNPYLLRLELPAPVVEDDASSATYDPASGYLTVTLTKSTPGEEFKDLDVLAKLLAPPKRDELPSRPVIEVIHSQEVEQPDHVSAYDMNEAVEGLDAYQREVLEGEKSDWHLPQQSAELSSINLSTESHYGFLDAYTGYFRHVGHVENEVNELGSDVEKLSPEERRTRSIQHEDEKWDEEYYMADYIDDENIQEIIAYKFPSDAPCSSRSPDPMVFTDQENTEMLRLPRKEYLATPQQAHDLYLTLLTILFSYAYDARTTLYDSTPESAWTIGTLTPAFSALVPLSRAGPVAAPLSFTPKDIQDALVPSLRRSLAFPLYRSFALAEKCVQDVSVVLGHGRRAVLRALLETKRIMEGHEVYYVYSKIWIEDFCRWVASDASEDILRTLGRTLASTQIDKANLSWDILLLEANATGQETREPDSDDESDPGESPPSSDEDEDSDDEEDSSSDRSEKLSPSSSCSGSTLSDSEAQSVCSTESMSSCASTTVVSREGTTTT